MTRADDGQGQHDGRDRRASGDLEHPYALRLRPNAGCRPAVGSRAAPHPGAAVTDEPKDQPAPYVLVGLVRIREHCTFTWRRQEGLGERTVHILPHHCDLCLREARRRGFRLIGPDGTEYV